MLFYRLFDLIHHTNKNVHSFMRGPLCLGQLLLMTLVERQKLYEVLVRSLLIFGFESINTYLSVLVHLVI